ncbi:MAG TPA: hypothetical protein PLD99_00750 [Parcubacteria group bacterium]|nr:hypothetical protein [Parcubacteria group bacterium]
MKKLFLLLVLGILIPICGTRAEGEVDLIWEASTFTHPFYEGLPLWSNESSITLTAIPHLPNISPNNIIYRWSKNKTVLGSLSGIGKNSLSIKDTVLSLPVEVTIDLFLENGSSPIGTATLSLTPTNPKLLIFENSPLYGMLSNKSIQNEFTIKEDEVTLSAVPLFSTVSKRTAGAFEYTWLTNSGERRIGDSVTYRAPEGGSGSASVVVRANNSKIIAQPKNVNFLIKFNEQNDF